MTTKGKILGFLSVGSSLYMLLLIPAILWLALSSPDGDIPDQYIPHVIVVIILEILAVIIVWFFIIYDIIQIVKDKAFSGTKKALWICAVYMGNIFTIPVFWFLHQRDK